MNKRNWQDLYRKLVDKDDMDYTVQGFQDILAKYALHIFGPGVLPTTTYPDPFLFSPNTGLSYVISPGVAFDPSGLLVQMDVNAHITVLTPDPLLSRKDLVCIRYNQLNDTLIPKPSNPLISIYLNKVDGFAIVVHPGTPSATPTYSAKDPGDVILFGVEVPAAAASSSDLIVDYSVREMSSLKNTPRMIQEIPEGDINGGNFTFTIKNGFPSNINNCILFIDDIQVPKDSWALDNSFPYKTITILNSDRIPKVGQTIWINYFIDQAPPIIPPVVPPSGSGGLVPVGSPVAPISIDSSAGIIPTANIRQIMYISGDGLTEITAIPQIAAGTVTGQELILVGVGETLVQSTNLKDGSGLSLNGAVSLFNWQTISLVWSGTVWAEFNRR